MDNNDPDPTGMPGDFSSSRSFALSGKIMLSAIIILLFVVVLMVLFHLYVRWYLMRAASPQNLRRRSRRSRTSMVFFVDPSGAGNNGGVATTTGLSESVLKSLPVFMFSASTHSDPIECAVCLSEFEENEPGRVLPNCKHTFHVDCIDMWFHSHSTCPLCRSLVEPVSEPGEPVEVSITVTDPVGDESGSAPSSSEVGTSAPSSFDSPRRRPAPIKVPGRNTDALNGDSTRSDSPASHPYRSPISRVLSLKRVLSREGRTAPPLMARTTGTPSECGGSVAESDIERGRE